MNASIVYAVCMALCGAVTALIPVVVNDYYTLCAISGAFGLFIAANYSLTSIILVELITLERFTNAYGLLLLVQGVANLMGPPLAGKRSTLHLLPIRQSRPPARFELPASEISSTIRAPSEIISLIYIKRDKDVCTSITTDPHRRMMIRDIYLRNVEL